VKVGDMVVHKKAPRYGKGRIVSFKAFQGTVMVRWENIESSNGLMYHFPRVLKIVNESR